MIIDHNCKNFDGCVLNPYKNSISYTSTAEIFQSKFKKQKIKIFKKKSAQIFKDFLSEIFKEFSGKISRDFQGNFQGFSKEKKEKNKRGKGKE